ncbi:MAG: hypothetical protein ACYS9X_20190 [Planctomycetota bacterium]
MTADEFASSEDSGLLDSWLGRYVRLDETIDTAQPLFVLETRTVLADFGNERFSAHAIVRVPYDPTRRAVLKPIGVHEPTDASVLNSGPEPNTLLPHVYGRVSLGDVEPGKVTIDSRASRFHPASIAGIVVGAMGIFVFGLYLRRWVKERRAA